MTITARATAIGFTEPFGSGSTTCAEILKSKKGYLATRVIELLETDETKYSSILFDGIRNLGEIETLKDRFGRRFYLLAIECPTSERWERVGPSEYEAHNRTIRDFLADDERDRDQEYSYGQQVQLCVDNADAIVINDAEVTSASLRKKIVNLIELVTGEEPRYANAQEILMNLAYSSSHGTKCLKRQVGAVVVAAKPGEMGDVVGQGFNDNPFGTPSCVDEETYGADPKKGIPGQCFRDIVRYDSFVDLAKDKRCCPACGETLSAPKIKVPPWRCQKCNAALEEFFWPERAMSLCTAVHAEVAAILTAGRRAQGATLYTTTFPCFQCAEKLTHCGIKFVVYTEPYPDIRAAERLEIAGIKVARFEGVRSGRFDDIFARARPYINEQVALLAKKSA